MKVLVTGASGFIGSSVCKALVANNHKVVALVRKTSSLGKLEKIGVSVVCGDLLDPGSLEVAFSGVDVVVNCAASLSHHKPTKDEYQKTNVVGVNNVVSACIKSKVKRLIHISTVAVYGPTNKDGASETSKVAPFDDYSRTKHEGDKIIMANYKRLPSVILRPTIAYGPGDVRPVFLRLFRMVKNGISLSVGMGDNYLHTIYIDDLARAVVSSINKKGITGRDFIIGDEVCPTMNEILDVIESLNGKKCIRIKVPINLATLAGGLLGLTKTIKFASEDRKYKIERAKKTLGFVSKTNLIDGMRKTHEWYSANSLL